MFYVGHLKNGYPCPSGMGPCAREVKKRKENNYQFKFWDQAEDGEPDFVLADI